MNQEQQKELERAFASEFLKLAGIEDPIDPDHLESPDVIITRPNNTLGVEVTQIFIGHNTQGISRVHVEGGWDLVLSRLEQLARSNNLPGMHADFLFDVDHHIPKSKSQQMAERLLELVISNKPEKGGVYRMPPDYYELPKGLNSFTIDRLIDFQPSLFTSSDASWVPWLTADHIVKSIKKKEPLRTDYLQNCDEIWLLLVLYGGKASGLAQISDSLIQTKFDHNFDQMFLFDAITERIWPLQKNITKHGL